MKNQRRRVIGRELAFLAVPTLAFVGWGLWSQRREPFQLVIEEVETIVGPRSIYSKSPAGTRGVQVSVAVGHRGPAPAWWGEPVNAHKRVHFTGKGKKDDGFTNADFYPGGTQYFAYQRQYIFIYEGDIPQAPKFLKEATCHVSVELRTQTVLNRTLAHARISTPARLGSVFFNKD